jgi:hypothetical protein
MCIIYEQNGCTSKKFDIKINICKKKRLDWEMSTALGTNLGFIKILSLLIYTGMHPVPQITFPLKHS